MDLIERAAEKMKKSGGSLVERAAEKMVKAQEQTVSAQPPHLAQTESVETPIVEPVKDHKPSEGRGARKVNIDLESLKSRNFITPDSETTTMAEEFRIVKRSLLLNAFARGEGAIRNGNLMLVTSTQPGEGKTFCSVNLAMSIASERDVTVLLVDADTHKPEVLRTLGVEAGRGLVDVVADESLDLSDCLLRTNIENLVLLPAGRQHNLTTELLASERMGVIVEQIAKRYPDRIIIFDSPPVLASSVASVLALHVGQILFVVEAERTREPQLKEALSLINSCQHINLLLNKSRFSAGEKKFGSYYGYGT